MPRKKKPKADDHFDVPCNPVLFALRVLFAPHRMPPVCLIEQKFCGKRVHVRQPIQWAG